VQLDLAAIDRGGVAPAGLRQHFPGEIDAGDPACALGQVLDDHTRPKTHFQHMIFGPDFEKPGYPDAEIGVRPRHDDAAQPPQHPARAAEGVQQQVSHEAHGASSRVGMVSHRRAVVSIIWNPPAEFQSTSGLALPEVDADP
jgi:hypothetical protein